MLATIMDMWRAGNNGGHGYAIGSESNTPREAAESEGWAVVRTLTDGTAIARKPDGSYAIVGDAHGPWVVDVGRDDLGTIV